MCLSLCASTDRRCRRNTGEQLARADATLDTIDAELKHGDRLLRGMTISGAIQVCLCARLSAHLARFNDATEQTERAVDDTVVVVVAFAQLDRRECADDV